MYVWECQQLPNSCKALEESEGECVYPFFHLHVLHTPSHKYFSPWCSKHVFGNHSLGGGLQEKGNSGGQRTQIFYLFLGWHFTPCKGAPRQLATVIKNNLPSTKHQIIKNRSCEQNRLESNWGSKRKEKAVEKKKRKRNCKNGWNNLLSWIQRGVLLYPLGSWTTRDPCAELGECGKGRAKCSLVPCHISPASQTILWPFYSDQSA